MTRKEQIIEAGIEYTETHNPNIICGGALYEQSRFLNRNRYFEEGAKWVDKEISDRIIDNEYFKEYTSLYKNREDLKIDPDRLLKVYILFLKIFLR